MDELFASQDVYSASFLPTALHICCRFITDIYLTPCACRGAPDKSQLFCLLPHTWVAGKGLRMFSFFPPSSYLYWYKQRHCSLFITKHIFSQRESVSSERVCTQRHGAFTQSPPAIKQKLSFFLTGCHLLDLQSARRLCSCLTDWVGIFLPRLVLPVYLLASPSVCVLECADNGRCFSI